MYCISIQIQSKYARDFNREDFLKRVRHIRSPEVDTIKEKGKLFLSFNFFTEFPQQLWQQLNTSLYQDVDYAPILAPVSVAICEDEESEDCLLLHHYDSSEELGSF